ncbi:MAG: molybdenum cofactor guanylyltransferase [Flavobacteriales bacterium]|nr:molybdenum cofactor guanylyltransferase [Flavobacteriales bacterium]
MQIGGIILAGGKSSRMKKDKGLLTYNEKPMAKHVIDVAQNFCEKMYLMTSNPEYDQFGLERLEDTYKDTGPLAGIQTGLRSSEYEYNLVLSCDMPHIDEFIIKKILTPPIEDLVIISKCGENVYPLVGLYSKWILPSLDEFLAAGNKSVLSFLHRLGVKTIVFDDDFEYNFMNVNTPDDYEALL